MHAFLDVTSSYGEKLVDNGYWLELFTRILDIVLDNRAPQSVRSRGNACLTLMTCSTPSKMITFLAILICTVQALPVFKIYSELLLVRQSLHARLPQLVGDFITVLVNHGLQWAIRYFAEEDESSLNAILCYAFHGRCHLGLIFHLASLVHVASGIKPHLVETVLGVAVQSKLSHSVVLDFVAALVSRVHLKARS